MIKKTIRPCLRWPGNKFSLLKDILPFIPKNFNNYHEPFIGSGALFLNVNSPNKGFISDLNPNLVNFYFQVQNNFNELIARLSDKENSEEFFYAERNVKYECLIDQAAQLYYLNRTCFNGIYRVNSSGEFNVPYGKRTNLNLVDLPNLETLHQKLKFATISCGDFDKSRMHINENDFVFLDPPYSSHITDKAFLMYNEKLFTWEDQLRLKLYCEHLIKNRVHFIMSNLFSKEVFLLFANELNLKYHVIERYSRVGSKIKSRGVIKEYLFTNVL